MRIVVELTEREADEMVRARMVSGAACDADEPPYERAGAVPAQRELESAHRKVSDAIDAARFLDRVGG